MPLSKFRDKLENDLKKSVKLIINDNRSTMLSVKWEPKCTKVSLHRFFLNAPKAIWDSLECYIKQKPEKISPCLKSFIEMNSQKLDYSHRINPMQINVEGDTYNLKEIFYKINGEYFKDRLNLQITWFGKKNQKYHSKVTFGLYNEPLKLIKINRLLDNPRFPEFFVSYVVYHEALHAVCPSYYDERGKHRIHNKEFKEQERQFRHYDRAIQWLKLHRERLFLRKR